MADDFSDTFNGKFYGVLNWAKVDEHWARLRANNKGWYVWQTGEQPPQEPLTGEAMSSFLDEAYGFLKTQDRMDRAGFMYVDEPDSPQFIKVFDPRNMGAACAASAGPVLPYWVISRMKPVALTQNTPPPQPKKLTSGRKNWWSF